MQTTGYMPLFSLPAPFPLPTANLVACYPFDEGTGNLVTDTWAGHNLALPGSGKPVWVTGGLQWNNRNKISCANFSGPAGDVTILGIVATGSQGAPCYHFGLDSWSWYTNASSNTGILSVPADGSAYRNIASYQTTRFFAITQTGNTAVLYYSSAGVVSSVAWTADTISASHGAYSSIYVGGYLGSAAFNLLTVYYYAVYSSALNLPTLSYIYAIIKPIVVARGVPVA